MISAFLEPETKAKINFLSGEETQNNALPCSVGLMNETHWIDHSTGPVGAGQKKTDALLEYIDVNVLESDYGGNNPSKDRGVIKVRHPVIPAQLHQS